MSCDIITRFEKSIDKFCKLGVTGANYNTAIKRTFLYIL